VSGHWALVDSIESFVVMLQGRPAVALQLVVVPFLLLYLRQHRRAVPELAPAPHHHLLVVGDGLVVVCSQREAVAEIGNSV